MNLIGSFECLCQDGFRGNGQTCSGIHQLCIGSFILENTHTIIRIFSEIIIIACAPDFRSIFVVFQILMSVRKAWMTVL